MSQPGWTGSLRVCGLYFAGVIFGSLAASIAQPANFLVGASAGVYALIAAHLGNLKKLSLQFNKCSLTFSYMSLKGESGLKLNFPLGFLNL
jgi:membrane associated rhomboid family serine protease